MRGAGRHRLVAGRLAAPDRLVGQGRGGDVDIGDRLAEKRVAHRAPGYARLLATFRKYAEHALQMRVRQPLCPPGQRHRIAHA